MRESYNSLEQATVQSPLLSNKGLGFLCSFDIEVDEGPTKALLHQQARFLYIVEGKGVIQIQGQDFPLEKGMMVALMPWQYSIITHVDRPLHYYKIVFHFELINNIIKSLLNVFNEDMDLFDSLIGQSAVYLSPDSRRHVENICQHLKEELGVDSWPEDKKIKKDPYQNIMINNLIVLLTIYYCRNSQINSLTLKQNQNKDISRDDRSRRLKIFSYIYEHLSEKISLSDLEEHFYMSQSSIGKYIKEVSGMSYSKLLVLMRVTKSINMLLYTNLTLEELASLVGYCDAAHISHILSQKLGMTPNEFRKNYDRLNSLSASSSSRSAYSIISYMNEHSDQDLNSESVADYFKISVGQLNRFIEYHMEQTFYDFLHRLRVEKAAKLLVETKATISEIAYDVGYNNDKTFNRNFKKIYKIPPGEFREKHCLIK